jgi:hypothetical protein
MARAKHQDCWIFGVFPGVPEHRRRVDVKPADTFRRFAQ